MSKAWDQVTWQEIEVGGVLTKDRAQPITTPAIGARPAGVGQDALHQVRRLLDVVSGVRHLRERTAISYDHLLQGLRHLRPRVRHRMHHDGGGGVMMARSESVWRSP